MRSIWPRARRRSDASAMAASSVSMSWNLIDEEPTFRTRMCTGTGERDSEWTDRRDGDTDNQADGSASVKALPSSMALSTDTSPFIARARSRLIASPSPVPSRVLVSDRPT